MRNGIGGSDEAPTHISDRNGRYYVDKYLHDLRQVPLLDNAGMIDRGRRVYSCRQKMLAEMSRMPGVLGVLVDTHRKHQDKGLKVGNYALSVGDQSVEAMDVCLEANQSSKSGSVCVQTVETDPEILLAALDELEAHYEISRSTRHTAMTRRRAFDRASASFLRLEFRWGAYYELVDTFKALTDSVIGAAAGLLEIAGCSSDPVVCASLVTEACVDVDESADTVVNRALSNANVTAPKSARYRRQLEQLIAIELSVGVCLSACVSSRAAFDKADRIRSRVVSEIAQHNLLLVARKVRELNIADPDEMLDAIQEGNEGLMVAAERYKYWMGRRFSTVAVHWIRQRVFRDRKFQLQAYEIPVSVETTNFTIARARKKLQAKGIQEPTHAQLAEATGMKLERVQNAQAVFLPAERDQLALTAMPDDSVFRPADRVVDEDERIQIIRDALQELDEPYRVVCIQRFGIGDGNSRTLEELSDTMQLSKDRIRQIEREAFTKLLRGPHGARIKSLVGAVAFA